MRRTWPTHTLCYIKSTFHCPASVSSLSKLRILIFFLTLHISLPPPCHHYSDILHHLIITAPTFFTVGVFFLLQLSSFLLFCSSSPFHLSLHHDPHCLCYRLPVPSATQSRLHHCLLSFSPFIFSSLYVIIFLNFFCCSSFKIQDSFIGVVPPLLLHVLPHHVQLPMPSPRCSNFILSR